MNTCYFSCEIVFCQKKNKQNIESRYDFYTFDSSRRVSIWRTRDLAKDGDRWVTQERQEEPSSLMKQATYGSQRCTNNRLAERCIDVLSIIRVWFTGQEPLFDTSRSIRKFPGGSCRYESVSVAGCLAAPASR